MFATSRNLLVINRFTPYYLYISLVHLAYYILGVFWHFLKKVLHKKSGKRKPSVSSLLLGLRTGAESS